MRTRVTLTETEIDAAVRYWLRHEQHMEPQGPGRAVVSQPDRPHESVSVGWEMDVVQIQEGQR